MKKRVTVARPPTGADDSHSLNAAVAALAKIVEREGAVLKSEMGLHGVPRALAPQAAKLLVASGLTPQLGHCASCGASDELVGFSGAAGGVVCASCEAGSFPLSADGHTFLVAALAASLADVPTQTDTRTLRLAERAITETAEHHAHVRLRASVAR